MSPGQTDVDFKERLIANVKKEVKQVMEEAVTRKFIHEESGSVTSLCAAVEACLSQGLRRRALGLFKTSSTTALLHKVAKHCSEALYISKKVIEIEQSDPNKRSSSSSDSTSKPPILKKNSSNSISITSGPPVPVVKYLWIRLALYEKKLSIIIEHLVTNALRYYERESLVADPDYGSILSSLLVGPCALEYSKTKTPDHFWTDPPADELIQRHRIGSGHPTPPSCRRPIMNFKRSLHTSSEDGSQGSFKSSASISVAKNHVESLHQNSRTTLLYGKNNVLVLPKDVSEPMPGYLSLHQSPYSLIIKWTPNQLMNGYTDSEVIDKSLYWSYSLNINIDEIVYVHCHQASGKDTGGTIIFVGQDGVQRPPIHFPEGGHMGAFLSCLETGLLPHGQLDPPLWSQKGIGKIFPWAPKNRRRPLPSVMESVEELPIDYVFRVVNKGSQEEYRELLSKLNVNHIKNRIYSVANQQLFEFGSSGPRRKQLSSSSTNESSDCSTKSLSLDTNIPDSPLVQQTNQSVSIALVCSTMRRQIISRAFYGWLAYCRHLSTVRTHLSGLVNGRITPETGTEEGLTKERWDALNVDGVVSDETEVYRLVYFGGVEHEIRKNVWPYLLGHYIFGSTQEERDELDEVSRNYYETTMSEWLAVEAIVRQRDKEKTASAVAKLSSESCGGGNGDNNKTKGLDIDGEIENEVFEDNYFSDLSDPEDDDVQKITEPCTSLSTKTAISASIIASEVQPTSVTVAATIVEPTEKPNKPNRANKCSTDSGNVPDVDFNNLKNDDSILKDDGGDQVKIDESNDEFNQMDKLIVSELLHSSNKSSPSTTSSYETVANDFNDIMEQLNVQQQPQLEQIHIVDGDESSDILCNLESINLGNHRHSVIVTDASIDIVNLQNNNQDGIDDMSKDNQDDTRSQQVQDDAVNSSTLVDALQEPKSACVSPASSNGGVYSRELLELFGLNLHRVEKDVQRCDRHFWYFKNNDNNLDKLRNVVCTYVWEHLDIGYMQGMCDLVAPLLVLFDDESMSYGCFCRLMERMIENFPNGNAMDMHFANMRSMIQILDAEMYDIMHANGDYTHFYFCYRWFLLDFKREFVYDDVFAIWEVIWSAKHIATSHFVLFLALALLEYYRDIILPSNMDFTDVIKFFNDSAETHPTRLLLSLSRNLVLQLQTIIENK